MKPTRIFLRCFAEYKNEQWSAVCIDLCLAAQARSSKEAIEKLESMVNTYVTEAMEDAEYGGQLLDRKSPFLIIAKYHFIRFKVFIHHAKNTKLFNESLPLKLA